MGILLALYRALVGPSHRRHKSQQSLKILCTGDFTLIDCAPALPDVTGGDLICATCIDLSSLVALRIPVFLIPSYNPSWCAHGRLFVFTGELRSVDRTVVNVQSLFALLGRSHDLDTDFLILRIHT